MTLPPPSPEGAPPEDISAFTPESGSSAHEGPHVFSTAFRKEMSAVVYTRVEIALTIILDGGLIAIALVVRAGLLWLFAQLVPDASGEASHDLRDWGIHVIEWVLNLGLVGTVVAVTIFDLWKRVRQGLRSLNE